MPEEHDHFRVVRTIRFGHVGSDDLNIGITSCSVLQVVNISPHSHYQGFKYDDTNPIPVFSFPRAVDYMDLHSISGVWVKLLPVSLAGHPSFFSCDLT